MLCKVVYSMLLSTEVLWRAPVDVEHRCNISQLGCLSTGLGFRKNGCCAGRGREKYIRDGGKLGKPKGSGVKTKEQLETEYRSVIRNLKAGQSIRNTAKITGVSTYTIQRVKKTFNI